MVREVTTGKFSISIDLADMQLLANQNIGKSQFFRTAMKAYREGKFKVEPKNYL